MIAGAAERSINPAIGTFLYGYPHVARAATGVHDDLRCAALFLGSPAGAALILANDVIFVGRELVERVRAGICARTGLTPDSIAITATHTHSGPVTVNYISNRADPVVPSADPEYLAFLEREMIAAGVEAFERAMPAEIGVGSCRVGGVGTNRHDPTGPHDPEATVLMVRAAALGTAIGCVVSYAMHPTVLHEDSTLISSDFPHFLREYLWDNLLTRTAPVLFLNGASGDQSPRHIVRSYDFAEARRLGERLGWYVEAAIYGIAYTAEAEIACRRTFIDLEPRSLLTPEAARGALSRARAHLEKLKQNGAARAGVRTAECDVFGAEETVELARAAVDGSLEQAIRGCTPAEVQVIAIGGWRFAFWPGEFFVEYGLAVKARAGRTQVVTLANGELQGYIVTSEAAAKGVYEAGNALFAPENGAKFVQATIDLIATLPS